MQSLEGGILYHLDVKVAILLNRASRWRSLTTPKRNRRPGSDVAAVRCAGNLGAAAAEVSNKPLVFPDELNKFPELSSRKRRCTTLAATG